MSKTIVILHGWRVESSRYSDLKKILQENNCKVYVPDMPGSGGEPIKKGVMHVDDYVDFVLGFFKKNKIDKAVLICHSFGGRVGAKLTAKNPDKVDKLILTGTPLIKQQLSVRKKVLIGFAKFIKSSLKISFGEARMRKVLYYLLGEWDYYKAPKEIRETFKAIITEDISPNLPKIKTPTLVVWGEKDTFVSKSVGLQIYERIKNSKYIEIPNATHKLPYENPVEFAKIVLNFIEQQ